MQHSNPPDDYIEERPMKHLMTVVLASVAFGALSACSKQSEDEAAARQTAPAANETAANASGTTTYYGSPDEQNKN